ncbi:hypothetical protein D3C80_1370650 [compost metagenome]
MLAVVRNNLDLAEGLAGGEYFFIRIHQLARYLLREHCPQIQTHQLLRGDTQEIRTGLVSFKNLQVLRILHRYHDRNMADNGIEEIAVIHNLFFLLLQIADVRHNPQIPADRMIGQAESRQGVQNMMILP